MTARIDDLIAASSIGAGLRDIEERGIEAHVAGLKQEMAHRKKRKKATPTTARTLAECRRRGWIAGVVERRIPFPKPQGTKFDFLGVIDVIAVEPGRIGSVGIQSTTNTGGHHAKHRDKILAESRALSWVEAQNRLELWTWAKQGAAGKAKRWTLRIERFEVRDGKLVGIEDGQ